MFFKIGDLEQKDAKECGFDCRRGYACGHGTCTDNDIRYVCVLSWLIYIRSEQKNIPKNKGEKHNKFNRGKRKRRIKNMETCEICFGKDDMKSRFCWSDVLNA